MRLLIKVTANLLLAAMLVGKASGQRTDTVFQPNLILNATATPALGTVDASRNIGQMQHEVVVILSDAPTKVCAGQNIDASFEASFDNSTFFSVGPILRAVSTAVSGASTTFSANHRVNGAYPFIRFRITTFDTVNCLATVHYVGTLSSLPDHAEQRAFTEGFTRADISQNTIGTFNIVAALSGRSIAVYGLVLSSSAVQTIRLRGVAIFMAANSTVVWTPSAKVYTATGLNSALTLELTAAQAIEGFVIYRYQD